MYVHIRTLAASMETRRSMLQIELDALKKDRDVLLAGTAQAN